MKSAKFLPVAALVLFPATAIAHGAAVGPHGGPSTHVGPYHVEAVVSADGVALYVMDMSDQPVDVAGAKGEATVMADKKVYKVTLEPAGPNVLKGTAPGLPEASPDMKLVTSLTLAGKSPMQSRFDMGRK